MGERPRPPILRARVDQADLGEQGMRTRVGRDVRDALADFRITGTRLEPVPEAAGPTSAGATQ